jgi:hypothetical protein
MKAARNSNSQKYKSTRAQMHRRLEAQKHQQKRYMFAQKAAGR